MEKKLNKDALYRRKCDGKRNANKSETNLLTTAGSPQEILKKMQNNPDISY